MSMQQQHEQLHAQGVHQQQANASHAIFSGCLQARAAGYCSWLPCGERSRHIFAFLTQLLAANVCWWRLTPALAKALRRRRRRRRLRLLLRLFLLLLLPLLHRHGRARAYLGLCTC